MDKCQTRIDWDRVKQRLNESAAAMAQGIAADTARLDAAFRQRAEQLAFRPAKAAEQATSEAVLVFSLGAERYGISLRDVLQVRACGRCTPLPAAPPAVLGVVNLNGEIRSVISLAQLIELPAPGPSSAPAANPGYLLVLRHPHQPCLAVDHVEHIESVTIAPQRGGSDKLTGISAKYVRGTTRDRVLVLNTDAIRNHPLMAPAHQGSSGPAESTSIH